MMRLFFALVRWDVVREMKRKQSLVSMLILSAIILFIFGLVLQHTPDRHVLGPAILWVTVFFAGTIGLSRSFAVEQERDALGGMLISPIDPEWIYLGKIVSVGIPLALVEAAVLVGFCLLFDVKDWGALWPLLIIFPLATLGYLALGVLLSAMTASIGAGEVLLRILILPALVPILWPAVKVTGELLRDGSSPWGVPAAWIGAWDAVYLVVGWTLFATLVEE